MDWPRARLDHLSSLVPGVGPNTAADLAVAVVTAVFVAVSGWFVVAWATSPLRKFPGPLLAGWTNLWRVAQSSRCHLKAMELHEKYGPVVRVGPNLLILDYPELVRTIYGTDEKWCKTEFYKNSSAVIDGKITFNLFSEPDAAEHTRKKRPVAKYFTMSAVLRLEPHIDSTIAEFIAQLDERFVKGPSGPKECDLGRWVTYFAWDLSSSNIFSKNVGYLDQGRDFDGAIETTRKVIAYFQIVGQMPWLDYVLDKNPLGLKLGPPGFSLAGQRAAEALAARLQTQKLDPAAAAAATPDFLQHFIEASALHPDVVGHADIISYTMLLILAGADTSANLLAAAMYMALKHGHVWARLAADVRALACDPALPVPYAAARTLPYLDAVLRETMRLHPVVGMPLERRVPAGGLALPNADPLKMIPPGTAVGVNAYVLGRNPSLWGADADVFRPERWLDAEAAAKESEDARARLLRQLAAVDFVFGAGARICLGKHLALVEMFKVLATLANRYDVELAFPEREWKVRNFWLLKGEGLVVRLRVRE
ncbi:cytochrome P450 [Lasiosphaeria ovina]|uniref:Cytochrome P450 n=1 Tax=Lasiosphaeria ovina TaxID=92902 RepID=A0AAE0KD00_9PEZI|nr:cytochrome P450 [Lasiosphaeria ovina]